MKKKLLLIALLATGVVLGQDGLWKRTNTNHRTLIEYKTQLPEKNLFDLNIDLIRKQLSKSPNRFGRSSSSTVISLPNAEGKLEKFKVYENSNMDAALQAKYPQIRSYIGIGIDNPTSTAYFSMSPLGFKSMTLNAGKSASFIEPYSKDLKTYSVYKKADKKENLSPFECKVIDKIEPSFKVSGTNLRPNADDGTLRTFRLALSVTGEYTTYFGGTVAQALAAINATMTRVNGVFEKDFNTRMNLIANNDVLIYTNASTDPYSVASTGSGGAWNTELQNNLTNTIGNGAYDIGHLFGASGGGGNAGCIGCICVDDTSSTTDQNKGSGYTSPGDGIPQGDNFDIDYVAHEMGHQFGANHTHSHSKERTGANMEPGSGSTIMGYAGITPQDVQAHSDAYFHAYSIQQVTNNIKTKACAVNTPTGNAIPTANAGLDFTIPKSTPFVLTGTGTDANGDVLTYIWEQFDSATSTQTGTSSAASTTKVSGPIFRSYTPTTIPSRYFPQMASILTGATTTQGSEILVEALPSIARTMNFRFTVRDNRAGGGANNSDDMIVTVNGTAGPFAITSQGSETSYTGGTSQLITWNVAGTTANGVNCSNVDILWSTNNGATWTTLLAGTPNDGSENITIPNTATTTGRIMVKGSNHIFFDVNNANITVNLSTSDTIPPTAPVLSASGTTTSSTNLSWNGDTDNVGVIGYDVYQGTTLLGSITSKTYNVTGLTPSTTYSFTVKAKDAAGNISIASNVVSVTTLANVIDTTAPTAPILSASGTTTSSTNLSWNGDTDNVGVTGYEIYQGTTLLGSITSKTYNVTGLTPSTTYSFTVKAKDAAGNISIASNIVSVTTLSNTLTYCTSKGNSTADEKIGKVVIGTINNTSTSTVGYENFTTLSTSAVRSSTQTITITPSWNSTTYPEGYALFIDYNQDGDFTDAGETVWTKAPSTTTPVSGTFTIPATAILGATRMRISMKYNGIPTSCETFSYGQVEDYTINITSSAKENQKNIASGFEITVFPIPTSEILTIKGISEMATYKVYNLVGQIVLEGKINNEQINVTNCKAGNYILEVSDLHSTVTKRFIKE
ncbi:MULTISPECIES: reprolysin-like metallopeptidase [Flavobacterium]|uniref:T9SS C-terminal target domain-containing protein n=2 Tax=Flavobacterium TaxID=237 RepID=A0AA94F644_9FLAO|nr:MULTISPECIES: zinc-dependent metalloprotease family protein [Flavobacterium]MCH4830119.1 fibronectin type III domain-containing protein [Flavobacterium columnare]MCH4832501.1 fibronectin type III domain-containing protein [Flavobacterium columnare]OWP86461.1 secretion protein [Flavobacterium covae]